MALTYEELRARCSDFARAYLDEHIPEHMREPLLAYVFTHRPAGHFLTAVLSNDLKEACARADEANAAALRDYVIWLYNHAPSACWGSPAAVADWLTPAAEARGG